VAAVVCQFIKLSTSWHWQVCGNKQDSAVSREKKSRNIDVNSYV